MTKSKLIKKLSSQCMHVKTKILERAIKEMLNHMISTLANGERIEIRGFGSFFLYYRNPRIGRNPKTGNKIKLAGKYVPRFKPGKDLRERTNVYN